LGKPFRHRLRVRYNECDPQNAVFNANYLAYFDIEITELWRELGGYDEMVKQGLDLVVAEARVRYLAPLRFDEEFDVAISVAEIGTTSLRTEIAIERGGETVAEGELRHVFVTTDGGGKTPVPDGLREALSRYAA
jgi:acyl-CoA thioester hydrolase